MHNKYENLLSLRKQIRKEYYQGLSSARERGTAVCWATGMVPIELLNTLDVAVCIPESYSALCCASQIARPFSELSESHGFSSDLCSYGRVITGMMYANDGPYGPMPRPDFIVADATICDLHDKMWEAVASYFGIPLFVLDGAFRFEDPVQDHELAWRVSELKRLTAFVENLTKRPLDTEQFKERIRLSAEARELHQSIHNLRQEVPCPWSTRQTATDLFYLVSLCGTKEAVDYFSLVFDLVSERVQSGIGEVPNERYRLFYDNLPIWYWLDLFNYLAEQKAIAVFDSYTSWTFNGAYYDGYAFDADKPFESLALSHLCSRQSLGFELSLEKYRKAAKEWRCQGALLFDNRSCKVYSAGSMIKASVYQQELGIPSLVFAGEQANPQSIDQEHVKMQLSTFLERLE